LERHFMHAILAATAKLQGSSMPPFALPIEIEKDLRAVRDYWLGLRRGENEMPFWDDVELSALPEARDSIMLIDVFERPERFRFGTMGSAFSRWYGKDVIGGFTNEIELASPFEYLTSQCSATVESRAPTYYEQQAGGAKPRAYARLLLPLWGEGNVRMLLGAVTFASLLRNHAESLTDYELRHADHES
jgi:hypothetical protein